MQRDGCAVSVIIPTRDRPHRLAACLAALAGQLCPPSAFEVIVVDDGGEIPLEPVLAPFRETLQLQLMEQAHAGPARARNLGASHASGALLVFTDDDCEPHPDWISAFQRQARDQPERLLGGRTINALPGNLYSTASQLLIDYLYAYHAATGARRTTRAAPAFFTSNNLSVPAAAFRRVGGFDEQFRIAAGEDRELCDRWQRHGLQLAAVPDAVVDHAHTLSLRRFCRQHANYGRGAFHFRQARARHGLPPLRREPLGFYARLITYPLRAAGARRRLSLMALLLLSQIANLLGFVLEQRHAARTAASS